MYKNNKIGVFVPAYNEERHIGKVLEDMPDYVDTVLVVDDASIDKTSREVKRIMKKDDRIILHRNEVNKGNGAGAKYAYQKLVDIGLDIIIPVAGDDQIEVKYLPKLLDPVISGECEFAKGNRFLEPAIYNKMPTYRYMGNIFVTMLNKFSTGYYSMYDSLNGYYAIRADTLGKINFNKLGDRYEFENSLWVQLNINNARGKDVSIPATYKDEKSTIKLLPTSLRTLRVLIKGFFDRLLHKYVLYNLSPIGLFFMFGSILALFGAVFGVVIFINFLTPHHTPASTATVMISIVPLILGFQLLLQAVVLDIQNEPKT